MNKKEYEKLVKKYSPSEDKLKNALMAFVSGGIIGLISTIIYVIFLKFDMDSVTSTAYTIVILILASSILTGIGFFDNLVEKFKCGIIIPITGFSHSMTSCAIDNKKDGFITGLGSNLFKLAGSVLLYGTFSAFILVVIKVIFNG
ncbi:MAG: SpoVA/SpoVAEb family sporulation membrane protein [Bacilli bacterium]|nr:SpoVA/SpoVAEb family sporulation membrane protein [Bacilli bacterium]